MPTTSKNQEQARRMGEEGNEPPNLAPEIIRRHWDRFFKANSYDMERHGKEALKWFARNVSKNFNGKASEILGGPEAYRTLNARADRSMIGKLYLYEYAAEEAGDNDSGLYDRYPLVFFFNAGKTRAGNMCLWGLNMHYLAPAQRAVMYEKLMTLKMSNKWTPKTKLKLQWDLIKTAAGSDLAEKAVHAYRVDRFESRLVEIPSTDWIVVTFLNIQKWLQPKSHSEIHKQSDARKRIYKTNIKKPRKSRK